MLDITPPQITPPQISEERIMQLWIANSEPFLPVQVEAFSRAILAERDRQWLARLEPVQWLNCTAQSGLHPEPPKLLLQQAATLYRIKEQG